MKSMELKIDGMSCGHCVMSVKKELGKIADVEIEDVHIGSALVTYDDTKVTTADFAAAIERAGYHLVGKN